MIIKMIKKLRRRMDVQARSQKFVENIKTHTEMKNTIMETKNTLEGINSRLNDTKEWIRELEERRKQMLKQEKYSKNIKRQKSLFIHL